MFSQISTRLTRALLGVIVLSIAPAPSQADPIDFRVSTFVDSGSEGPDRVRPFFMLDQKRISFKQVQFTDLAATPAGISIHLAKPGTTGLISVTNSQFSPGTNFQEEPQPYITAGQSSIPKGAENVEFKGADYLLYAVSGRTGVALNWSYTLYGRNTSRQVAFINIDSQHQVCLTTVADEESWSFATAVARRFMNSWYVVEDMAEATAGEKPSAKSGS